MSQFTKEVELLKNLIDNSKNIVFFGGAGVSTESNIPDFRSVDGLYNQKYRYSPEIILSHTFFVNNPQEFFRFYFDKMIYTDAKPNAAHIGLYKLEKEGKLKAIVTQNIDGLHQMAGSKRVHELHGSVLRNYCERCGKFHSLNDLLQFAPNVPICSCGGIIKPDVVLYEEELNGKTIKDSLAAISECDLLIIGGTSLNVYPAASFVSYANGKTVIINKSTTAYDSRAELVVNQPIGEVFSKIC
ncbi:MAG: NAD-dependent protein deacylase [Clostridia bacterium]|nr:NAD-dependent protein deacylase [Clostridia bacterium]